MHLFEAVDPRECGKAVALRDIVLHDEQALRPEQSGRAPDNTLGNQRAVGAAAI